MAYDVEVVRRARQRLENAKADKESENRQKLQAVYENLPRVRQIDQELRKSMVLATQAVFAGNEGAQAAMEEVKKANLALQAERKALIEDAFGENYLDESPICDRCGGLGYMGTQMCSCLQELCRQEQKKELTLLTCGQHDFDDFRLDYYPDSLIPGSKVTLRAVMQKTFQDCRAYAADFDTTSPSLLFSGDTGLGKTFLSACIARSVAEKGYSVVYESAAHLFEKLEKAKFSGDETAVKETEKYTACDLLIVDDLGTEMGGQFVTTALYTLINDRILSGKPTIISTNLTKDAMDKRYSPQILSRLRGNYKRVAFVGDDIRILKNRGATL